ncbi:DUF397 domain-containing protein [Streptomyces sp. ACA25]|uniref:DUF397 domain-containing protein n=1 Tax=Streptomyces sp. ACA25 TaxID=3022596 RepID=UPI003FA76807
MAWFKSSYSDSEGANCVEIAAAPDTVHIRDSKTQRTTLTFTPHTWATFLHFTTHH